MFSFRATYSRLGKKAQYNPIVIIFGCFFLVKDQFPSNPNLELKLGGCQLADTGHQPFPNRPHFCTFDITTCTNKQRNKMKSDTL